MIILVTKTITITALDKTYKPIVIGRQYENNATEIVFDCELLIATYGNGTATLYGKRAKDSDVYVVPNVIQNGSTLTWTVSNYDTEFPGTGAVELRWATENDISARPILFVTVTLNGLGEATGESKDIQNWIDSLVDRVDDRIKESLQEAKDSGEFTGATPDITMSATIDQTVGTPAVSVTKTGTAENPAFSLAFSGIKGETGDCNLVAFEVENGELYVNYTIDDSELSFSLTDGNLEVEING